MINAAYIVHTAALMIAILTASAAIGTIMLHADTIDEQTPKVGDCASTACKLRFLFGVTVAPIMLPLIVCMTLGTITMSAMLDSERPMRVRIKYALVLAALCVVNIAVAYVSSNN